ncbi:MAG: TonB family protein [Bacteroidales bacterium]|jgi:periplasmic protein TonB|nr:TonB family protein [Bacteroidales bacterium]
MSKKNSYKANIEKRRVIYFLIGLNVSLFFSIFCVHLYATQVKQGLPMAEPVQEFVATEEMQQKDETPLPPLPEDATKQVTEEIVLKIVKTATADFNFDFSTEADVNTVVEDVPLTQDIPDPQEPEPILEFAQIQPEFPGGMEALSAFLNQNTKYPPAAYEARVQGTVVVEFVVEKDGSISKARVINSLFPACDEEAMRVVQSMPKWKPGESNGKKARVFYSVPFVFSIQQK